MLLVAAGVCGWEPSQQEPSNGSDKLATRLDRIQITARRLHLQLASELAPLGTAHLLLYFRHVRLVVNAGRRLLSSCESRWMSRESAALFMWTSHTNRARQTKWRHMQENALSLFHETNNKVKLDRRTSKQRQFRRRRCHQTEIAPLSLFKVKQASKWKLKSLLSLVCSAGAGRPNWLLLQWCTATGSGDTNLSPATHKASQRCESAKEHESNCCLELELDSPGGALSRSNSDATFLSVGCGALVRTSGGAISNQHDDHAPTRRRCGRSGKVSVASCGQVCFLCSPPIEFDCFAKFDRKLTRTRASTRKDRSRLAGRAKCDC